MKEKEGIVRRRWITILTIVGILDVVRSIEVRRLRLGKPKAPGPPDSMGCCQPKGCTEKFALNYDRKAVEDDGSCVFLELPCETCEDGSIIANDDDGNLRVRPKRLLQLRGQQRDSGGVGDGDCDGDFDA